MAELFLTEDKGLRPAGKIPGGKWYLHARIIKLMRPHDTFDEPCVGMGSVCNNKNPAPLGDFVNDAHPPTFALWECICNRNLFPRFYDSIAKMKYDGMHFAAAQQALAMLSKDPDAIADLHRHTPTKFVQLAVAYYCVVRMSRGGMGVSFAWSDRLRGGRPGDVNAWETAVKVGLPALHARHSGAYGSGRTGVSCGPWLSPWQARGENHKALFYFDPPYLVDDYADLQQLDAATAIQSEKKIRLAGQYECEMPDAEHGKILRAIVNAPCMVMISGYDSALYRSVLQSKRAVDRGWRRLEFELPNNASQEATKERRVEIVWLNFEPAE